MGGSFDTLNFMDNYSKIVKDSRFTGNPDNSVPDAGQPSGKRDASALGFAWRPGWKEESILIENCVIDANGVAEGLKLSYCHDVTVRKCTIIGGYEDCVDIVRGGRILFENCRFIANNTKHHFTIKCMVNDVTIINSVFVNNFNKIWDGAFVDMGNWGTYNKEDIPKTNNIKIINCSFENVSWWKRILTRRLYAENSIVKNTTGFNLKIPSIFIKLFWNFKRKPTKTINI